MAGQALAGVKVLEYAELAAGPYCGKLLADLGAEVIKIEHPPRGDVARLRGPFPEDIPHPERSGLFLYLNSNKLGITLDLHTATGRKLFRQLAVGVDIVIQALSPVELKKLGLDYDSLREVNESIIITAVSPFGQSGPYCDYKGYNLNFYHGAGVGVATAIGVAPPGREPVKAGGRQADYHSGLNAAVGTLGALFHRMVSGEGQAVDISQQESVASLTSLYLAMFVGQGQIIHRVVPRRGYGGFRQCKDGYVYIAAAEEHQWRGFVDLMGNPEWAMAEELSTAAGRAQHAEEIGERVGEWLMEHTMQEIFRGGQERGCPFAVANTVEDLMNSPHLKERAFFETLSHPATGPLAYPGRPYRLSKTPWQLSRSAPLLGEHNEEIICGRLGYSRRDLVKLREAGVI